MADNSNNHIRRLLGLPDSDMVTQKDQLIEEFETLVRRFKRRGIANPIQVIDDHIGRASLDDAKVFGLKFGIVFTFVSIPALYALKAYCLAKGLKIDLPEDAIIKFAMINGGAVMTFGFGSALNSAIKMLRPPAQEADYVFIPETPHQIDEPDES